MSRIPKFNQIWCCNYDLSCKYGTRKCSRVSHAFSNCPLHSTVLPEMALTANVKAATEHEAYQLSCVVEGYPAKYPVVTTKAGESIPTQSSKQHNEYRLETVAVIPQAVDEEYVCSVETHYEGKVVGNARKEVIVPIYSKHSSCYQASPYIITAYLLYIVQQPVL